MDTRPTSFSNFGYYLIFHFITHYDRYAATTDPFFLPPLKIVTHLTILLIRDSCIKSSYIRQPTYSRTGAIAMSKNYLSFFFCFLLILRVCQLFHCILLSSKKKTYGKINTKMITVIYSVQET